MDLSIIIVSYNTKDFLKACVESIYKTTQNIHLYVMWGTVPKRTTH